MPKPSSAKKNFIAVATVLTLAFCIQQALTTRHTSPPLSQIERGRHVYVSEGCINCHSQYVRPHTGDVMMWGPSETIDELRAQHPPLIGNRRQGPDLSQIGSRRSPLWLKAHFFNPRDLNQASFMPSYASLYRNGDGEDLTAYLRSLHTLGDSAYLTAKLNWHPSNEPGASVEDGAHLFHADCATCHQQGGTTRTRWSAEFHRLPPLMNAGTASGPWLHLSASDTRAQRMLRLQRIVKFGLTGTDMPGHEYLSDRDVTSLALWLDANLLPSPLTSASNTLPEKLHEAEDPRPSRPCSHPPLRPGSAPDLHRHSRKK